MTTSSTSGRAQAIPDAARRAATQATQRLAAVSARLSAIAKPANPHEHAAADAASQQGHPRRRALPINLHDLAGFLMALAAVLAAKFDLLSWLVW